MSRGRELRRLSRWIAVAAVALAMGWGGDPARAAGYRLVDPPRGLTGIDLVAKDGMRITRQTLSGRWTFLALGYTHCPDICPTVLSNLAAVSAEIGRGTSAASPPRFLFVSVDPARDTPETLGDYVAHFDDAFVGATGDKAAIDRLVKAVGGFYRLGRKDRDGFYAVDHSAEIYLLDSKGRLRARFMPPLDPKRTAGDFRALSGGGSARADAAR